MGAGDRRTRRGELANITTRGRTRLVILAGPVPLRPRERAVLAAIAASHPRPVVVDDLIHRVWGDNAPQHARKSLHNHIGRIRQTSADVVETTDDGYSINSDIGVDHLSGDPDDTPLADLSDTQEVNELRAEIDARCDAELEQRLRNETSDPTHETLLAARHLVDAHPDREGPWSLLAAAQAHLGQRRGALASIRSARRALAGYGLEIGDELVELEARLLTGAQTSVQVHSPEGPARVHPHRADPFVGRAVELRELVAAWGRVLETGAPQLVIVRGPAGIGKTRLVDEFVRKISDLSASEPTIIVARERIDDARALGSLTDLLDRAEPPSTIKSVENSPTDIDVVVDLQRRVDAAIATIAERPTVWAIDDLQWMPTDSLRLLTHALELASGPLLVVTTHRSGELDAPGLLDRRIATTVVELDHMKLDELEELISAWSIPTDHRGDLDLLHRRTAGLPLFASEVVRVASRRGDRIDATAVPAILQDWVRSRLEELDDDAIEVAQAAAAIGVEFDVDVVAASVDLGDDRVDSVLDDLVTRGVIAPTTRAGQLQFAHAIVHEVVYAMLGPARARRRHARIASVIAARPDDDRPDTWHASLALHLYKSGAPGNAVRAHAVAACDDQLRNGAWSAAAQSINIALHTQPSDGERADLLARQGRALLHLQRFDEATTSLTNAIDISRPLGLTEVQGRAALDLVGRAGRGAAVRASDNERITIVHDALVALGPDRADSLATTVLRSELERELAFAMLLTGDSAERKQLLDASVARIERLDDPPAASLAAVLLGRRYAYLGPCHLQQRLDDIDRVLALDRATIRPGTLVAAYLYLVEEQIRSGRARDAHRSLEHAELALKAYPEPYLAWAAAGWRVVLTLRDGDVERAEALAFEAADLGGGSQGAVASLGVNITNIRLLQYRSGEVIGLLEQAVDDHPEIPAYRAVLALCAAEAGDRKLAAHSIDWFAKARFTNLPSDTSRSLALSTLAHAAAEISNTDAAAKLSPLVADYTGQHFVVSTYGSGGAYWGPASHALARLALTVGDELSARRWFAEARREAADAPLFAARIEAHARSAAG